MDICGLCIMGIIIFTLAPDRNNWREERFILSYGFRGLQLQPWRRHSIVTQFMTTESVKETIDITVDQETESKAGTRSIMQLLKTRPSSASQTTISKASQDNTTSWGPGIWSMELWGTLHIQSIMNKMQQKNKV